MVWNIFILKALLVNKLLHVAISPFPPDNAGVCRQDIAALQKDSQEITQLQHSYTILHGGKGKQGKEECEKHAKLSNSFGTDCSWFDCTRSNVLKNMFPMLDSSIITGDISAENLRSVFVILGTILL